MANWIFNKMVVSGDRAEEFLKCFEEHNFDCLLPTPKHMLSNGDQWYYWRLSNWGCKWLAEEIKVSLETNSASFITPNSPPDYFLQAAASFYGIDIYNVSEDPVNIERWEDTFIGQ